MHSVRHKVTRTLNSILLCVNLIGNSRFFYRKNFILSNATSRQRRHDYLNFYRYPPQYGYPAMPGAMPGYPMQPQLMGPIAPPQFLMAPNGSIRSVHSVPMLAANSVPSMPPMSHTWDGEPCPVHHQPAMVCGLPARP